jgi:hypothetical protein
LRISAKPRAFGLVKMIEGARCKETKGATSMIVDYLVNGAMQALWPIAIAFLLSRFTRDIVGRSLLAFLLFGAAFTYIVFAVQAGEGAPWVVGELVGVGIYGTMGLLGLRGSPWWLAAGWAAHPIWDVALHYFGPGGSFAPEAYAITCISFDLLVAAYIAITYGFGLLTKRGPALRQGAH